MTKPIAFALDMLPLDGESHSKWQSNPTEFRALRHVERVCEENISHTWSNTTGSHALGHVEKVCEEYSSHTSVESLL
ncbi:hypothetical protein TNCT_652101 [Trichonephila clavata]|uniref:Uncharacterized protein n=1 Tax=Trichonephila clavata TaxID=2740835 RepID=A0A8X6KZL1_TRICU|nr:hypothetical protein TNCT_652101 [Trichonephila clavata]